MKVVIEIPGYNPKGGFEYKWEEGFEIEDQYNSLDEGSCEVIIEKK